MVYIAVVNLSTLQPQLPSDPACPLQGGDTEVWRTTEATGQHQCVSTGALSS